MDDQPRLRQWKEWVAMNVKNGVLTQRDVEWISLEPSPVIGYYPIIGTIIGLTAAGIASRLRLYSTLRTWGYTRTVVTAAAGSGAGYLLGSTLSERSLYRFENSSDSPALAQIAKIKRKHAIVRDAVEQVWEIAAEIDEQRSQRLQETIDALDSTFSNAVESVLLSSLIPEDVQVHGASKEEIRSAVQLIIQELDDGIDISEHDLGLMIENEVQHWSNRPVEAAYNPAYPALIGAGAIGVYARLLRKPPFRWRWLAFSFVSIYVASFFHGSGFGTFSKGKPPDDWLTFQLVGMEVRASISEKIAASRARVLIQSVLKSYNDDDLLPRSASLLGSASRDVHILFKYPTNRTESSNSTEISERVSETR